MKKLVLCGLAAALTSLAHPAARADTIGFTTTGRGFDEQAMGFTVGYSFTLANSISVTQLGFFDEGSNGLSGAEPVTIWNSGGTVQANATIPQGVGTLTNGYKYVTLATPVTLIPGTYTIGSFITNNNDVLRYNLAITGASGVTYGGVRSIQANAFPPSDISGDTNGIFGPNFQFTAPVVPEPSTWALLGAGAGLLGVVTLRRRGAAHLA